MLITVCTPTYNRAHTLHRPFESLMQQTDKDFTWLVIDDGSSDNTEELVKGYMLRADFPIEYVKQSNAGRAAALNTSYSYIKTELVVNLDSDDGFVSDAIEKMKRTWDSLLNEDKTRIWCITGHCIDSETHELIGGQWPDSINVLRGRQQRKVATIHKRGEKCCCRKVEILRAHCFPHLVGTKFVPEDIVWTQIDRKYDQYYTNDVYRVYYRDSADGLSKGKTLGKAHHISLYHAYVNYVNVCFDEIFYNKNVQWSIWGICREAIRINKRHSSVCKELNAWYKRMIISIVWLPIWLFSRFKP